ncbi:uncharacterized protein CANTADRAFT_23424 [Suhomyces tanzawaensis NRRL Y-17324]|uniref:U1 small nuclear ribonucleoprotein component SNU71 n=1 Tax=Suhomyces tanzawaensis NRRL Y-17324 TaxID=984487 RepID=A0A1E4SCQ0_9ASCO|nr:uncharacterized protein CANTADRAFT_23424 [Suhomyces tanzawaensis NRRL Y-17324]ODV77294.1 hypothetical protein CANTADRAFT_23424 [Suhomyces tanzawaensis NRRL Y-17324]
MFPVTTVAPYALTPSNKLLSVLKPIPSIPEDAIQSEVRATIPVFASVDVSEIISTNTHKLLTKKSLESKQSTADEEPVEDAGQEDEQPEKYVEISSLLPSNKKDQLSIVIIQNFPNLRKIAIEKILNVLIAHQYQWSHVSYDFLDSKLVYIKLNHLKAVKRLYSFKDTIPELFKSATIYFDPEVVPLLDKIDVEVSDSNAKNVSARVNQILQSNIGKSLKSGTEDLDAVLNYYSKYKVDNNELIDVPNTMKDMIVKDIIKFRSKVLIMERDNRKKEIEQERIKTKERLKQVFQGLQTEDVVMVDSSSSDLDSTKIKEEHEDMNEEQYEQHLIEQEQANLEKTYQEKLLQMKKLESERNSLEQKLDKLKNYETTLIDNKFKYIEDITSVQDQVQESKRTLSTGNSLASLVGLYFADHSQYLKLRTQKRAYEESQDQLDREAEEKEVQSNEQATQFIASIKKPKVDSPKAAKEVNVVISELPGDVNSKLQSKIVELVEEYLGIKDTLLIDVINENLKANNLEGKLDLVNDLTEVLDDDAANLADDLWAFIATLV